MTVDEYLMKALAMKASDMHVTCGIPVMVRVNGKLLQMGDDVMTRANTSALVKELLNEKEMKTLNEKGEVDTAYQIKNVSRFRVNAFKQKSSYGAVLRIVNDKVPTIEQLKLPNIISKLCTKQRGLILVTGPTGSGKSTTLASMINHMNHGMNHHILTIEDPIEYLHPHGTCIVNQRQIGKDSINFASALRAALRQDPDVILVGEMRDPETITVALTAAETGHLVLSTLHTIGAAKTIDRIVDSFAAEQHQQIRTQLASVIQAVISQQIIPRTDIVGRVAALEIMISTSSIKNLIREGKTHQIQNILQTSKEDEMETMDNSLITLYKKKIINKENLFKYSVDIDYIKEEIGEA